MSILKAPTRAPLITNITTEPFNVFPEETSSVAAPVLESFSSRGVPATTSIAIAAPTGIESGDLLLACVASDSNETFTPPSGWTQVDASGLIGITAHFFTKTATGSEPADYTWNISTSEDCLAIICRISGANTSVSNFSTNSTSNAATPYTTSTTPVNAKSLMVSFGVHDATPLAFNQTPSTENSFSEITTIESRTGSSTGGVAAGAYSIATEATAQVDATFGTSIAEQSRSFLIEVEPA